MRGDSETQEVVICGQLAGPAPFRVVECNRYADRTMPSLHQMGQIAWVLMTDKNQRKIGFVSPQQFKEKAGSWASPIDNIEE